MISWRHVETDPLGAEMNMAIDEALALSIMNGESPPVLRIYSWAGPAVSIGYFQKRTDINLNFCAQNNIPVVRRPTGGRAILHGEEVTYSFSARGEHHSSFKTLHDSYEVLSQAFLSAFIRAGLDVQVRGRRKKGRDTGRSPDCFNAVSFGEIVWKGKKIIGSAQRRLRGGFLQQGSIPLSTDRRLQKKVFGFCSDMSGEIRRASNITGKFQLAGCILQGFRETFQVELKKDVLTPGETKEAERLLKEKYCSAQWLERR